MEISFEEPTIQTIDTPTVKTTEKIYTDERAKVVDISGGSGIIKESDKKPVTLITDDAIEKIPEIKIPGYTDEQCSFIQRQHKELLRYSRDNNANNEVAFVFNGDFSPKSKKIFFGSDDRIDFGQELYGHDIIMMHNHPRNSSFSFSDIVEFIRNDSIKTMTITKNNGSIEVLTKTGLFVKWDLLKELNTEEKRIHKNRNVSKTKDDRYRKLVDKFIGKYEQKGVLKWIR